MKGPGLMTASLSLTTARTLALHTQQLTAAHQGDSQAPGADMPMSARILDTVARLTCLQIDTLHMVRRSHYVTLWSRLGQYDPADLDRLIYDPAQRRLFEYWYHAASIIPLDDYRYHQPLMQRFQAGEGWGASWARDPHHRALMDEVTARIRAEGGLRAADFKHDGAKRGSWWDWKPAKRALEQLYNRGELMIADRVNFQRVYDLRERVLPDWVDTTSLSTDAAHRHRIERAAHALGIGRPEDICAYAYLKRGEGKPHVAALLADGDLRAVACETVGGGSTEMLVHRANLPLIEAIGDGTIRAERTTFLNPFDNLLWARGRDELLWGFRHVLEAYKPAPQREWGYYTLPILHRDRLVGRFDPKLERQTGTLILRALYLDDAVDLSAGLVAEVAAALRDFLAWHGASNLVIERSEPAAFGAQLLAAL